MTIKIVLTIMDSLKGSPREGQSGRDLGHKWTGWPPLEQEQQKRRASKGLRDSAALHAYRLEVRPGDRVWEVQAERRYSVPLSEREDQLSRDVQSGGQVGPQIIGFSAAGNVQRIPQQGCLLAHFHP